MTVTPVSFETVIKAHLDNRAAQDAEFAKSYANPAKSIAECVKYIFQVVEKSARDAKMNRHCVVSDEEIFGLAVHYYDEPDLKVDGPKSRVEVAQSDAPQPTETPAAETTEKKPKTKKRKSAPKPQTVEIVEEVDENIPAPLQIPIF